LPSVRNRRVAALEVSICRLRHGVSDTVAPQFEPADFKEIAAELGAAVWPMPSGGEPANNDWRKSGMNSWVYDLAWETTFSCAADTRFLRRALCSKFSSARASK
jgi:dihydropteroate synthase